jgi:hypothetical protein
MIPFQAIGGLNIYTTRLPAAVGGILAVWLIFYVGKRLFGPTIGLAAVALLAIDPWHLQHSRNGLESSVTPLVSIAPLALLLWAGLLSGDKNKSLSPRPVAAALAGLLTGIGCYGHWEVRLFMPAFLFLLILFTLPSWLKIIKTRKGALAVALFVLGFAITWGALIWQHIFHPEGISRHALAQKEWLGSAPFFVALKNMSIRYIQHFSPNFLFKQYDPLPHFSPPQMGYFYWYMAPLMSIGLILLVWRFISSASARILLAFVIAYPVGDCLVWGGMLSVLRSLPGVCALVLLSAFGAVETARWLWAKDHKVAIVTAVVSSIVVISMNLSYLYRFYVTFPRDPEVYHFFHTDLVEACEWLKPRFDDFDAIYFTTKFLNMPYVITAVVLNYDPKKWFSEPIEFAPVPPGVEFPCEWDFYKRYGKMYFIYDYSTFSIAELQKKFSSGKVLLVLRPEELVMFLEREKLDEAGIIKNLSEHMVHTIYRPDGNEVLWLSRF